MSKHAHIPPEDRIPIGQKVAVALGQNTDYVATIMLTTTLWMPFFNIGLGLSPVVLGIILMVLRAWDAISDPLMGNISDNARTRWGRRRPFMFVAAITTACLYPLLWHFPQSVLDGTSWLAAAADWIPFIDTLGLTAAEKSTSLYLTFIGLIFFTSFTCWGMPYYGLQLELTPNYDERTRLTAVMALVSKLTSIIGSWTFVTIIFVGTISQGDFSALEGKPAWFQKLIHAVQPWLQSLASDHIDEKPIVTGMRLMCWVFAGLIIFFGIIPAIFVKERFYEKEAAKQPSEPFWQSVKASLKCGPLWSLISTSFFLVMGYSAIGSLGQYVNIYYVCRGDMLLAGTIGGIKGTLLAISGIAMLPLFAWLGEKYDKRTVVLGMLGMSMFGHFLNYWLMTPAYPYLQIVAGFFESSSISAVWLFLPSMKADVADYDEQSTHRRREGAINAFYSWFIKASLTASMGIGGVVLQTTGFDRNFAQQPDDVLQRMFWSYLIIPIVIWAVAVLSMWFYPLTRVRCTEIRHFLENRRGQI